MIFIKFALHIPQPHQEEPPEKAHVELVIIHTIYQVSKFKVQGSRFFIICHIHNHTSIISSEMQVELKKNTAFT